MVRYPNITDSIGMASVMVMVKTGVCDTIQVILNIVLIFYVSLKV